MRFVPLTLPLVLALTACGASEPETTRSSVERLTPQIDPARLQSTVHDNTEFALSLYRELSPLSPNLIYSPHSISTAVAMLWAGARTTSETSIATALHFGRPQAELHPVFNHLDLELAARNATVDDADVFTFRVVNDVWAQKGYDIKSDYLDTLGANYGAGVRRVDFLDTEPTRQLINDWIADQTEDRIQELFPEGSMDASTVLALTNAVYFKADWADAFESSATAKGEFTLGNGSTAQVDFMHRSSNIGVAETAALTAVDLPYKGEELSLLVVMPRDLAAFEASLDAAAIETVVGALQEREVKLGLPKWTDDGSFSLKDALTALGMGDVFGSEADLTGIANDSLRVQAVVHKAFIEVSEEGTEAAAATGITVGRTSAPADPQVIDINKPFVYFLRDRATKQILFVGRVHDPR